MSGKHLKLKKTIVPCIVAAFMLLGNFNNVLAFGEFDGNMDIADISVEDIIVTKHEKDTNESKSGPLYKQTNFKLMREHVETQFGVIKSRLGTKIGVLYKNSEGKDDNSPSYFEALGNKETQQVYEQRISEVKQIANETFNDVSSDDWFAGNIPLAVYYTVLNGYNDMTFRGSNNITVAEISKVMAVACEGSDMDTSAMSLPGLGEQWYNRYFDMISKVMPYTTSSEVTNEYMNKAMSRAEIAYAVAKIYDNGRNELQAYIDRANAGDVEGYFNDLSRDNVCVSEGTLDNEQWLMGSGKVPARFAGAIMYLKDKGIMLGDDLGNSNALSGVTRAEAIALTERIAFKGVNYTSGEFKGTDSSSGSSSSETPVAPVSKYTLDTVLNPDAPEKYQYTVADLQDGPSRTALLRGVADDVYDVAISKEVSKRYVDEVKDSVKYENGIITFTLPDIKSDYHQIGVRISCSYNDESKEGFGGSFLSWRDSGTITFDTKGADYMNELQITLSGKSTYQQRASSTYTVNFDFLTGEVDSWTN